MDGITPGIGKAKLVCHTLLIESEEGLILIDTGLGMNDVHHPERISGFFRNVLRPILQEHETARYQIERLGFNAEDVRHIILTHLDFDHAGGIDDFPNAKVHVMKAELDATKKKSGLITNGRYSPQQLTHSKDWITYYPHGERWFEFQCVRDLQGLPPEILFVPLVGHTEGHAGVAVQTDHGWLLHAGDAYFFRGEMDETYHCTPGLRGYQKMMEVNRQLRLLNQKRLRQLISAHHDEVTIFSAHDAVEFLQLREGIQRNLLSHQEVIDLNAELGLS